MINFEDIIKDNLLDGYIMKITDKYNGDFYYMYEDGVLYVCPEVREEPSVKTILREMETSNLENIEQLIDEMLFNKDNEDNVEFINIQ